MTQSLEVHQADPESGAGLAGLTIDRLSIGEQLVIWAFRSRLADGPEDKLVRGFHLAFGLSMVEAALASFQDMVDAIDKHGRRPLLLHGRHCRAVSHDEIILINLVAASQQGFDSLAQAIGAFLVRRVAFDDLIGSAQSLAILMERKRLKFRVRALDMSGGSSARRLH